MCCCLILSSIKTLCQHLPFTWKSIYLPGKLATFIFSEQKGGVFLTESNVYREIILASSCFMKIVIVQLFSLFLWLKWAHGYDMRTRAKTIIHLLQQTQGFNSYILHLILFPLERLALTPRVKYGLVPFHPFPVLLCYFFNKAIWFSDWKHGEN